MLTPDEFVETYDEETVLAELPDRPITSLRDVQYLYGRLFTLATAGGGEYADFLTPREADDLVDEPESVIAVRIDLTGDPSLASDDPVLITKYEESLVDAIAHSKYEAARGIDHSITHRSGRDSDPEKLARYACERLTKWPTDDVVQEVAGEHDRGWVIEALAEVGQVEGVLQRIEDSILRKLGGPSTALLTVQVKLDEGGYRWPGEIDAFNEAMKRRKLSKLVAKNAATDSSGRAVDMVTSQSGVTVGMSEDPLNYYLGKQMGTFPGLDPDEAWRNHPLSEEAAVTVINAQSFVEACSYPAFGATIYYLPYFLGKPKAKEVYVLYNILYHVVDADDMTPIEQLYQSYGPDEIDDYGKRLRFYVGAVMKHQMSRFDVYGETLNGSHLVPWEVGLQHEEVLESWFFDPDHEQNESSSPPLPTHAKWDLLDVGAPYRRLVARGGYLYRTLPDVSDDGDAAIEDPRIRALVAVLGGDSVTVEELIRGYVDRIVDESDEENFPSFLVASQFAQLCALAAVPNVLEAETEAGESLIEPTPRPKPMQESEPTAITDGGTFVENRHRKIERFIEQTPALSSNSQRRGAFLLGALVGAVGSYQSYSEGRSTTLIDQYPVDSVTAKRIKKITQEALSKTLTYTREENRATTLFDWLVDRLRESVLAPEPGEWTLDTDDIRFYYALGVTYGMNDRGTSDDSE